MKAADRSKAARLEGILGRHTDHGFRTLESLSRAGFEFKSIEAAYKRLKVQRQSPGFTQRQIDIAVQALNNQEAGK